MATDYDYALNPPRPARQNNLDTCWACCMSALLESNLSVKRASESELVKQYASTPTGGVSIAQLPAIAKDFGYLCNAFQDVPAARATMTDRFIVDRLRTNGMLMAAWRVRDPAKPNETLFHAQIVWGVTYLTNQDIGSERVMLRTMNPWSARYELYPLFSVYRSDNMPMFACWPKTSRP